MPFHQSLISAVAVCILSAPSLLLSGQAQNSGSAPAETITIDSAAQAHPFPHGWEQMFGSGRAVLTLRESWRTDAKMVKQATNFEYVRFHAIFHDEMGVYDEDQQGRPVYNFSYVDQVYDGLLDLGIKPFVEISFMPRKLALNLQPHAFWYKQLPSPPKDPAKWVALIDAFTRHLVDRYGREEVEKWYFEVWNEPNIDFWNGKPQLETYFQLYDETAKAVKAVDSRFRIGGPATAQAAWADKFIAHCSENKVPFDFVSTHVYGNDVAHDVFGTEEKIPRRDMVARAVKKVYDQVKASAAPNTPIIWSEYNASYMNEVDVTDSAFMGPWLANDIRATDGMTTMMSYWDVSDVFEEQGIIKKPFYGGYGLVAERGIPKAAFRDFELLHRLGDQRLASPSDNTLVTKRADGKYVIALWNYVDPKEQGTPKTFQLELKGIKAKNFRGQFVAPGAASPLEAWTKMGSPAYLSRQQIEELRRTSELAPAVKLPVAKPIVLAPHSLMVLELEK